MTFGRRDWKWRIELRAATVPREEWVTVRSVYGRLYRFIERGEAEDALAELKKIQPHAVFRIVPA